MILLSPQQLLNSGLLLQSLVIEKAGKQVSYTTSELTVQEIKKHFADAPKEAKNVLKSFSGAGNQGIIEQLHFIHSRQRSGVEFDTYLKNAFPRKIHEACASLLPFLASLKCYHKIKDTSGRFRTAPCAINTSKPRLYFEVLKSGTNLQIGVKIGLEGKISGLDDFNRYHFFLEQNNEYYLLGYKDFRNLEWLESADSTRFGADEEEFKKHILLPLEQSYQVNRNGLLNKNVIDSVPQSQLMVSELSGSFLMLTPQWVYEGILIEGTFKEVQELVRAGKSYSIKRNREEEEKFIELLKNLHPSFEKQRNGYFYLTFDEARKKQWFLKAYHQLINQDVRVAGMDLLQHFRYSEFKPETEFLIKEEQESEIRIQLSVRFGNEEVPLNKLQRILLGGQHHLLLNDDKIAILDEIWLEKYATIIKHGRVKDNEVYLERWMAISQHETGNSEGLLKPAFNKDWWQQWEQWQSSESFLPLPAAVEVPALRPYQQKGYEWMVLLANAGAGACLADDMGLGKTLQTICFLANRVETKPGKKHLVICPSSLIYNWQQEFQKFAPTLKVYIYHGAGRRANFIDQNDVNIVITTYGTIRSDIDRLAQLRFGVVVLDESHNIKNPQAQVTQAVCRLRVQTRVALSGTPVMNNTFDLYSQLNFLLPGMFGSHDFFKNQYSDPIDRDLDPVKTKALQKLTAPFILRRTKEQVASDLPEKTELTLWCDMGAIQMEQYDSIRESIKSSIFLEIEREGLSNSKLSIIQGITRLRQACNSPLLLPAEERICEDSVKTEVLIDELTNNLKDHKVLVFSQFTKMLDLLAGEMERNGISFYHFDGQTPAQRRMEMVQAFQQEDDTTNVFLISLMAGNAGLTLTAADYVFLFDPWWNTAVQQQAIDRTHRIGQTKNVFAYKMACRDTIEEKIIHLQERKKALSEELIGAETDFVKNLTLEDIRYLFN
ncbi:DEAD/DEAH box helicase [Desertivirga xinjiangensis]|uniref:DEAD/DEAH box helicase n=1 Tax=Desertivirga xinjiangensis TaxID=539206 RepID=UPI00210A8C3D|nr:DEAD/DEAH box helicase [Pedobacter xinjiangensis]